MSSLRPSLLLASCLVGLSTLASAGAPPQAIALFNGKDLTGWTHVLADPNVTMEDVWSVKDGVLVCKGEPLGFIQTAAEYTSFQLLVEWRWAKGAAARLGKPPNSGVLMRVNGDPKPIPRAIEAQLRSGNAGDVYGFWGMQIDGDPARLRQRKGDPMLGDMVGVTSSAPAEKPEGEWNVYEITLDGPSMTVLVNGTKVNEAKGATVLPGRIGLQSEGGEIHFRRVELTPLGP